MGEALEGFFSPPPDVPRPRAGRISPSKRHREAAIEVTPPSMAEDVLFLAGHAIWQEVEDLVVLDLQAHLEVIRCIPT